MHRTKRLRCRHDRLCAIRVQPRRPSSGSPRAARADVRRQRPRHASCCPKIRRLPDGHRNGRQRFPTPPGSGRAASRRTAPDIAGHVVQIAGCDPGQARGGRQARRGRGRGDGRHQHGLPGQEGRRRPRRVGADARPRPGGIAGAGRRRRGARAGLAEDAARLGPRLAERCRAGAPRAVRGRRHAHRARANALPVLQGRRRLECDPRRRRGGRDTRRRQRRLRDGRRRPRDAGALGRRRGDDRPRRDRPALARQAPSAGR